QIKPSIVVLRDASQSMRTHDPYLDDQAAARVAQTLQIGVDDVRSGKPDRVTILNAAIAADDQRLLREIEYRGHLKAMDFALDVELRDDRTARSREEDDKAVQDGDALPPVKPLEALAADGQGTDLFQAIKEGLKERHTAAVILATDGQHTSREVQRDDILALARQEEKPEQDRIPIFVVGVGDPNKPRNLSVGDVYANPQAFPGEAFEVRAVVRGQDIGDRPVQIELIERRMNEDGSFAGEPKVIDSRRGEVIPESGKLDLVFKVGAQTPGHYGYIVRVEKIENESNNDDNEPSSPTVVKVLDDKAKVLLVAGAPTWEYRMVQRLLTREPSVELSCWLQTLDEDRAQEGDATITHLPIEKKELFAYDVVMLFDPDPIEFDEPWVNLLKEFVGEHAGGVLYMAGPKFSGRFLGGPRTRGMQDIVPVRLGDVAALEVFNLDVSNTRAFPLKVVPANVDQPMMRLGGDVEEAKLTWERMPGFYWSFTPEREKPTARTLIEHEHPVFGTRPVLVTGQYGSGRTVYMGFNGTWRWRKMGHNAEYFKKFWIETTRYLIEGRSLEGRRRGYVEVDKARYQLGDDVTIAIRELKDENFNLYPQETMQVELRVDNGQTSTLTLQKVPQQDGAYETNYRPTATGRHVLRVNVPAGAADAPVIETAFAVTLPTVETNEVALNKPLLVDIATASGGAYFEVDEIAQIPARIPPRIRETEIRQRPTQLWDTRLSLLLLVGLLTVEWAVRKGFKLL
ncbi:MAG: hypothetical protein KDA41_13745, partial [Planctomycetales bacterium]|nr:hypothetical protein [Planctomycetales bacterium]